MPLGCSAPPPAGVECRSRAKSVPAGQEAWVTPGGYRPMTLATALDSAQGICRYPPAPAPGSPAAQAPNGRNAVAARPARVDAGVLPRGAWPPTPALLFVRDVAAARGVARDPARGVDCGV